MRHGVTMMDEIWKRARGPVATELLELIRAEKADVIVSRGYGHSRLGEWIFGGRYERCGEKAYPQTLSRQAGGNADD